jgi:uncharacterized protein YneF (UPF0154 family)
MFSLILPLLILIIILLGAFIVIKKRWIDKKPTLCAQFTARNILLQYQNQQKKKSIEHVLKQTEEKKQDEKGDDIERFFDFKNREKIDQIS